MIYPKPLDLREERVGPQVWRCSTHARDLPPGETTCPQCEQEAEDVA